MFVVNKIEGAEGGGTQIFFFLGGGGGGALPPPLGLVTVWTNVAIRSIHFGLWTSSKSMTHQNTLLTSFLIYNKNREYSY